MKILLIGGTSSLSKGLIPILSKFSEVKTAGRTECDLYIDLAEPASNYLIPPDIDVLIHTAASFGGKSDAEILEAVEINVLGTLKLCQAAVQAKVKHFVFISSIFATIDENSEFFNIYALSKRHAEEMAKFICLKYSLPLTILRPSQIYGDEDTHRRHQPFLYSIVDKAQKGEVITIHGSHDPLRNFIHINDLINIIVEVLKQRLEGIYSCAYPKDVSFSEIVNATFLALNQEARISFDKNKVNILDNVFEKDDSIYEILDCYPKISIEDGIRRIVNYRKLTHNL